MMTMNSVQNVAEQVIKEVTETVESVMLSEIGDLVTMGHLVWEQTNLQIIACASPTPKPKFSIGYTGRFVLKDHEYIRQLEAQNDSFREQLEWMKSHLPAKPIRTN